MGTTTSRTAPTGLPLPATQNALGLPNGVSGIFRLLPKRATKAPVSNWGEPISLSDVVAVSGAPTLSSVVGPNGRPALKIVTGVGIAAEISFNSLAGSAFYGEAYLSVDGGTTANVGSVSFYATPDANYNTNFTVAAYVPYPLGSLPSPFETGGAYTIRLDKSMQTITGTINFPFNIGTHKLRITPVAGTAATLYIYGIGFANQPSAGRICVTCDDGYDSWFQMGQPIANSYNIPVTLAAIATVIDTGSGYASMRQLKSLVNAGGAVIAHGPNITNGSGNLISAFPAGDNSARVADMNISRDFVYENGLAVPGFDLCYNWPEGAYNDAGYGDTGLLDAAYAAGYTTGRGTSQLSSGGPYVNFDAQAKYERFLLPIIGHSWAGSTSAETTNISNIVSAINNVAAHGGDAMLMFHRVQPTSTADGSMSSIGIRAGDLSTILSTIASAVSGGTLSAVTIPDLAIDAQTTGFDI